MMKKIYVIFLIFNIASVSMMTTTITAVTKNQDADSSNSFDDAVLLSLPSKSSSFDVNALNQYHITSDTLKELALEQQLFTTLRLVYLHINETE